MEEKRVGKVRFKNRDDKGRWGKGGWRHRMGTGRNNIVQTVQWRSDKRGRGRKRMRERWGCECRVGRTGY